MACKIHCTNTADATIRAAEANSSENAAAEAQPATPLRFGVNSKTPADTLLQNNLTEFEWAARNKLYPNFWGRYLSGENALTKEEIEFLHDKGCKIAALYRTDNSKSTEEKGEALAREALDTARALSIPEGTAIFLELDETETASRDFMRGFAKVLLFHGFVPGFKANTDAKFSFDREYSRGVQSDTTLFRSCLIWAVAPSLAQYDRTTDTHFIHPDEWMPYAPSGITRADIAVWQYGKDCHPIQDDSGKETAFNADLVRNDRVILDRMF